MPYIRGVDGKLHKYEEYEEEVKPYLKAQMYDEWRSQKKGKGMIDELTIIIPTWNSMPEFEKCLDSFKHAFPEDIVKDIIVIDKNSTDGTIETAEKYGCKILYDDTTLGSARLKGLREAKTDWIAFIDSDIELPEGWFSKMLNLLEKAPYSYRIGWIYGRTIDDREPLKSEKLYKLQIEFKNRTYRFLKEGDRAYTNNTLCLRKPLLNAKIEHLNAWEDWVLTQEMLKAGYAVVEVPVTCTHLRSHTYSKFGVMTEAWGIAGELKAKGINPYTLLRPFWFLYWGTRCTFHFKDLTHFKFNTQIFFSMIKAIINQSKAFEWRR